MRPEGVLAARANPPPPLSRPSHLVVEMPGKPVVESPWSDVDGGAEMHGRPVLLLVGADGHGQVAGLCDPSEPAGVQPNPRQRNSPTNPVNIPPPHSLSKLQPVRFEEAHKEVESHRAANANQRRIHQRPLYPHGNDERPVWQRALAAAKQKVKGLPWNGRGAGG